MTPLSGRRRFPSESESCSSVNSTTDWTVEISKPLVDKSHINGTSSSIQRSPDSDQTGKQFKKIKKSKNMTSLITDAAITSLKRTHDAELNDSESGESTHRKKLKSKHQLELSSNSNGVKGDKKATADMQSANECTPVPPGLTVQTTQFTKTPLKSPANTHKLTALTDNRPEVLTASRSAESSPVTLPSSEVKKKKKKKKKGLANMADEKSTNGADNFEKLNLIESAVGFSSGKSTQIMASSGASSSAQKSNGNTSADHIPGLPLSEKKKKKKKSLNLTNGLPAIKGSVPNGHMANTPDDVNDSGAGNVSAGSDTGDREFVSKKSKKVNHSSNNHAISNGMLPGKANELSKQMHAGSDTSAKKIIKMKKKSKGQLLNLSLNGAKGDPYDSSAEAETAAKILSAKKKKMKEKRRYSERE